MGRQFRLFLLIESRRAMGWGFELLALTFVCPAHLGVSAPDGPSGKKKHGLPCIPEEGFSV